MMRNLLTRWTELEPERCEDLYGQTIRLHFSDDTNRGIRPVVDDLPIEDLALIQWAVQEAIVARGWWFTAYYTPESGYAVEVMFPSISRRRATSDGSLTEAILAAYLKALESER